MRMTREEVERYHKVAVAFLMAFENAEFVFVMLNQIEDWDVVKDPIHMPFGYARPFMVSDDGPIEWPVCCELIARQTSHLSLEDFNDYLSYVIAHAAVHIIYINDDYTLGELEKVVDHTLHESLPDNVLAIAHGVMQTASS